MEDSYRVLGYAPDDARLSIERHTDTKYPITRFSSREEVDARREELKFNLQMSAGLYPWPDKTPLNVRREKVGVFDGYSIEKIMFETRPGFWSTGNLFLPSPLPDKAPALLNVIGHWGEQRLHRSDKADYPQQISNFAKMGFICLVTDMIGMVDSRQISHDYGKGEKELWLSNGLGIMLWNNIRALDVLCAIPEVDTANIGVTGASGGGSQTLFLSLLDDRIKAAAPINMMSLHMQGGCQCENAPSLRRHTDNVEMCAMLAPRPLFLAGSDGDWTKYLESAELPAVLETYRWYGAEDMVEHFYQIAPHQYNAQTRHRVYQFFARHLMGKEIVWDEQPMTFEDLWSWTWFRGQGAAQGLIGNDEFLKAHKQEFSHRILKLSADEKRRMIAWVADVRPNNYRIIPLRSEAVGDVLVEKSVVVGENGEKLPLIKMTPSNADGKRVCLALSDTGKACLGLAEIQAMLHDGVTLLGADIFQTGESVDCKQSLRVNGVAYDDPIQPFHTTFNNTPDAFRVQDVCLLTDLAAKMGCELTLWAEGRPARAVVCALALLDGVKKACLEASALRLQDDIDYYEGFSMPGICAVGGLEGCLALTKCDIEYF